ncbi:MAG: hypothetical protein AB7N65_16070 [Vicinamibacterales bacterium]
MLHAFQKKSPSGIRTAKTDVELGGFSVERIMTLLTAVDQDVEIVIRQKPGLEALRESVWWLSGSGQPTPRDVRASDVPC